MPPSPESTRGWIGTLLPLAREGGPVLTLFILALGGLTIWWLVGLVDHHHQTAQRLFTALQDSHRQTVELALRCPKSGAGLLPPLPWLVEALAPPPDTRRPDPRSPR